LASFLPIFTHPGQALIRKIGLEAVGSLSWSPFNLLKFEGMAFLARETVPWNGVLTMLAAPGGIFSWVFSP